MNRGFQVSYDSTSNTLTVTVTKGPYRTASVQVLDSGGNSVSGVVDMNCVATFKEHFTLTSGTTYTVISTCGGETNVTTLTA
jgi:hypothetical protein